VNEQSNNLICAKYNITRDQLKQWRSKYKNEWSEITDIDRTRSSSKKASFPNTEKELFEWIGPQITAGVPLSRDHVQRQMRLMLKVSVEGTEEDRRSFRASDGWWRRFKRRWRM